jgi:hypothetical protein
MVYYWYKEKKRSLKMTPPVPLPKDFPAKYHEVMLRAMGRCVVEKHMHNPPEFEISLV